MAIYERTTPTNAIKPPTHAASIASGPTLLITFSISPAKTELVLRKIRPAKRENFFIRKVRK